MNGTTGKTYQTEFLKKQVKELDAKGGFTALSEGEPAVADGENADIDSETKDEEVVDEGDAALDGDATMADG